MLSLLRCLFIGVVIVGLVLIPQHLRHSALQRLGRFWNDKPDLSITAGLNPPPFGIGMNWNVRQQAVGRSRSGLLFRTFRYSSDFWDGEQQVICMPLLHLILPFYFSHEPVPISETQGLITDVRESIKTILQGATHGCTVIDAIVSLLPLLGCNRLTIDHDQFVFLGVNQELKTSQSVVEWLAAARAIIIGSSAADHEREPSLPYISFANHPDWELVGHDDLLAQYLPLSAPGGRVLSIARCLGGPTSSTRVTCQWRTAAYIGQIATVWNRTENSCGFRVNFNFIPILVNMAGNGGVQDSELIDFSERLTMRCWSPRFASDVFNLRQFKFSLRFPVLSLDIGQNEVTTTRGPEWPLERVEMILLLLYGSFGWTPDSAWHELGIWSRPAPGIDALPPGR